MKRRDWVLRIVLAAALACEGLFLLGPDGALVHAAQPRGYRHTDEAVNWWRHSRVHLGCSFAWCARPATRTASYRTLGVRGATWRAYGFCDLHNPPAEVDGLVYRQGHPPGFGYDVPMSATWTEIYFLLGAFGFAVWCAAMWRWARANHGLSAGLGVAAVHTIALAGLWLA
ncbi:MAG: hypothetical protein JO323_09245 [Acidobacteriia bacterium]|nr:hypothetical protein [Terriglobia bacterium]